MKKLTLLIPLFVFTLVLVTESSAQENYKSAVGARFGYPFSASFKTFLNDNSAIEVYAGTRGFSTYRWFSVSGAYQFHKPIEDIDGLQYYFGAGASVYFWNFDFTSEFSSTTIGAQGYLGLDYAFEDLPINVTLDWIPTIFVNSGGFTSGFAAGYGTLGVRYILSR